MRIAVFITGELRRIDLVLNMIKKYLLPYQNYDLYFCLQDHSYKLSKPIVVKLLDDPEIKEKTISVQWYVAADHNGSHIEMVNSRPNLSDNYRRYLVNSGTLHEYKQLFLCYDEMHRHECLKSVRYDHIMRLRTDSVFTKPMDFKWMQWSLDEVKARLNLLMETNGTDAGNLLTRFMGTLFTDSTDLDHGVGAISNIINPGLTRVPALCNCICESLVFKVQDYLRSGRYIITHRCNVVYFMRRELFSYLPIILTKGFGYNDPDFPHWHPNAEGQLYNVLWNMGIDIYSYHSQLEENSIVSYDAMAFEDDGTPKDSRMLFSPKYR